ncbi:MAG TPA: hypothetical protein VMT30_00455 [Candidatus Saccharimonadia bacterium]|nr:hypothetical protein [Candidatus Saccharimonadia bacterium]
MNRIRTYFRNAKPMDYVVPGLVALVYGYLAVQYWRLDTLGAYDAAGQVEAVRHAQSFWPAWHGWQSRELLGWPQGLLYPPGVHWLMAALAFGVGVSVAVKLVVTLALLSLPVAIWWYLGQLRVARAWRWTGVTLVSVVLLASPDYMGSNISGLFHLGLIPNFVALPLLFGFLGWVERAAKTTSMKTSVVLGGLFALLVWTHLIAAEVGAVYGLVVAGILALQRKWSAMVGLVWAGVIGSLLSAPFWVPFVRSASEGIAAHGSIASLVTLNAVVVLVAAGMVVYGGRRRRWAGLAPVLTAALFGLVGLLDGWLARRYGTSFALSWLNAYRLQSFGFGLLVVALVQTAQACWSKRLARWAMGASLGAAVVLLGVVAVKGPARFAYAEVTLAPDTAVQGRFLESFRRSESLPAPYTLQTKLLDTNAGASWAYGLFIESAPNSAFVKSLSRSLRPEAYAGEPTIAEPEDVTIAPQRVPAMLDLFAIDTVVSLDDNPVGQIGTWRRAGVERYYHLDRRPVTALAEVPKLPMRPVASGWQAAVLEWWKEAGAVRDLPYDASHGLVPAAGANAAVTVKVERWSDDAIDLGVASPESVPVLVKSGFARGWTATDGQGRALTIYRVAPSMMLVVGAGDIHLRYR